MGCWRGRVGGDDYFGRRVASFPDVTHRPHKDATASPVRVAAAGIFAGGSGPALRKGRGSGGRGTAPAFLAKAADQDPAVDLTWIVLGGIRTC